MKEILRVRNLSKSFGNFRLENINIDVVQGEIFGLIGPNGSGKTTTLKLIAGLLNPDGGEITFRDSTKKNFGFIQDAPFVYPYLTGYEHLLFVGQLYKVPGKEAKKQIDFFIELFDMESYIHNLSRDYSHGMRQKVAIASALLHNPELIMIDEPLVALDSKSIYRFKEFLRKKKEEGYGILLSTHSLDFAEHICNRVCLLLDGKIKLCEDVHKLKENYKTSTLEEIIIQLM